MELIGFVVALAVLGILAARFRRDSRDGILSRESVLGSRSESWRDLAPEPLGATSATKELYPTLAFIERAIGGVGPVLTASPHAPELETRARELTRECWSDSVWTTGTVSAAAFRRVLGKLAPDLLRVWAAAAPVPDIDGSPSEIPAEPAALAHPADHAPRAAA
jgi:hypothetical protein